VRAALNGASAEEAAPAEFAEDLQGKRVLATYASVTPPGWLLFVETPTAEAFWPIYASIIRSALLLITALAFAAATGLFLARRMVVPIRSLRDSAAQIGAGDLSRRITIGTGDELEALGHDFNRMAARLHDAHANLERKVEERTHELERANLAKSRFLTMASHDLRQPLQALGLLVAQLRSRIGVAARNRLVDRIDAAVETTNDLVNAAGGFQARFRSHSAALHGISAHAAL
jgi:signal transduction histidine kinase